MTPDELATALFQSTSRFTRFLRSVSDGQESSATWRALSVIDDHGPLRITEFAQLDRLAQPSATSQVRRMTEEGLARRTPDPDDGRATLVDLTDAGRARLAAYRAKAAEALQPFVDSLEPGEHAELERAAELLGRIASNGLASRDLPRPKAADDQSPAPAPTPDGPAPHTTDTHRKGTR